MWYMKNTSTSSLFSKADITLQTHAHACAPPTHPCIHMENEKISTDDSSHNKKQVQASLLPSKLRSGILKLRQISNSDLMTNYCGAEPPTTTRPSQAVLDGQPPPEAGLLRHMSPHRPFNACYTWPYMSWQADH